MKTIHVMCSLKLFIENLVQKRSVLSVCIKLGANNLGKGTRCFNREHTWLHLSSNMVRSIAQELPVAGVGLPVGLVGQATEPVHQGVAVMGDLLLVALLGGQPVDLAHGGVGVQETVNDGHGPGVYGDLVVHHSLVVTYRTI